MERPRVPQRLQDLVRVRVVAQVLAAAAIRENLRCCLERAAGVM